MHRTQEQLEHHLQAKGRAAAPAALKRRAPTRHIEDAMQVTLMSYLRNVYYGPYRISEVIFHVPNGGKRNAREAGRLKQMGVRAGVYDLVLPIPVASYHGGFFELKAGKNDQTQFQKDFAKLVYGFGYYTSVHWEWTTAAHDIVGYLRNGQYEVRAPQL